MAAGISVTLPSTSRDMISSSSVGWKPSTTNTVSPFISTPSVGSVPPMWYSGDQVMVPRPGCSWPSAIAM